MEEPNEIAINNRKGDSITTYLYFIKWEKANAVHARTPDVTNIIKSYIKI